MSSAVAELSRQKRTSKPADTAWLLWYPTNPNFGIFAFDVQCRLLQFCPEILICSQAAAVIVTKTNMFPFKLSLAMNPFFPAGNESKTLHLKILHQLYSLNQNNSDYTRLRSTNSQHRCGPGSQRAIKRWVDRAGVHQYHRFVHKETGACRH